MINDGEAIIYSGRRDGRHHEGVAIILRRAAAKSLIDYHPVSEGVIIAKLNTKSIKHLSYKSTLLQMRQTTKRDLTI